MNKFVKGSVAAAAAAVLLLGGAGSLAYWNDGASLAGSSITAGTLTLEAVDGAWSDEIDLWVPGDSSTYTATLVLNATGDNIQGEITIDTDTIVFGSQDIADQFDITVEPGALPAGITDDNGVFVFDGEFEDVEIPVTVTVEFPYDTEDEQNSSKGAAVDLSDIAFTVTQTAATGAVVTP